VTKFLYWIDVEVVPVTDIGVSVTIAQAALAWAQSAAVKARICWKHGVEMTSSVA
jgi:hypothetical protein